MIYTLSPIWDMVMMPLEHKSHPTLSNLSPTLFRVRATIMAMWANGTRMHHSPLWELEIYNNAKNT